MNKMSVCAQCSKPLEVEVFDDSDDDNDMDMDMNDVVLLLLDLELGEVRLLRDLVLLLIRVFIMVDSKLVKELKGIMRRGLMKLILRGKLLVPIKRMIRLNLFI